LIERGVSEADAKRQAALEFGNPALHVETSRGVWLAPWVESLWQDARYAVRVLVRQPVFTISAVAVLSLGIGLVSALVLMVSASFLRPWPVPDPSSIALITARPGPNEQYGSISHPEYRYLREHTESFSSLAANLRGGGPVGDGTTAVNVQTNFVTADYFETLGIGMTAGRAFLPSEENYHAPEAVAIISERLWRQHFGASSSLVGQSIFAYEKPVRVVGVAAKGFNDVFGAIGIDLWMPLPSISLALPTSARAFDVSKGSAGRLIGRLGAGVTREAGLAELEVLSRQFRSTGSIAFHGLRATDTRPTVADPGELQRALPIVGLLFAALMMVLLVACGNAGNLFLARALARQREIAIRLSLGASRRRVIRQLLTESLFVSIAAGALGLLCAASFPKIWYAVGKGGTNGAAPGAYYSPDLLVCLFVFALVCIASVLCGLGPALRLSRPELAQYASDRHGVNVTGHRLRTVLLAAQVAFTMVLLTGAGLLTRAIGHALNADPGFAVSDVQRVNLSWPNSAGIDVRRAAMDELTTALRDSDVAFCDFAPFDGAMLNIPYRYAADGGPGSRTLLTRGVSSDYFRVLSIPFVAGRTFNADEHRSEVVVSESVARLFPEGRAIGQQLVTGVSSATGERSERVHQIVGIVKDLPVRSLGNIEPVVYWRPDLGATLLVRTTSPATLPRVNAILNGGLPGSPTWGSLTLREYMLGALSSLVFGSYVAWAIGVIALSLATIGAFGVFAYVVEQRRREIAVRVAMGAPSRKVILLVLGAVSRPVLIGLAFGLALSSVAAPFLRSALYGLSPFDPVTYLQIAAILTCAATIATLMPAWRALKIDPATVLRTE
jgi:predicted permease